MAKRKRKAGESASGPKLKPMKDYREDQYIPYLHGAETGIVKVWRDIPDLTDGDVRQALRALIKTLERWEVANDAVVTLSEDGNLLAFDVSDKIGHLQAGIIAGLKRSFKHNEPLIKEDVIGVLKQINYSVGNMNMGLRLQNYLHYIADFLNAAHGNDPGFWADMGDQIKRLSRR